jgi:four helix bundle protein
MALASACCACADALPATERFALGAQMRRASISIPSNIAEGYGRNGRAEYFHHVGIARGSLYELETLIELACLRGYVTEPVATELRRSASELGAMLTKLRLRLTPP